MALGLAGTAGTFCALNVSFPPHQVTVVWSLFLPLIAALAYGWRGGALAATVGGAGFLGFWLWPTNGWANVVATVSYTSWYLWHGFCAERRAQRRGAWWSEVYVAQLLYTLAASALYLVAYPVAFRLNPPFFSPHAATAMETKVIASIVLKDGFFLLLLVFAADVCIHLPVARRALGLAVSPSSRSNALVIGGALVIGLLVFALYTLVETAIFARDIANLATVLLSEPTLRHMVVVSFFSAGAGLQLAKHLERRLEAESDLKAEKELIDAAVDALAGVFFVLEPDGRFVRWNAPMARLWGREGQSLRDLYAHDIVHPDDRADSIAKLADVFTKGSETVEIRVVQRPSGEVRRLRANARRLEIGGRAYAVGSGIDVTDLRNAEESARNLFEAVEHSLVAVVITDAQGRIEYVNPEFVKLTGRPREEVLGEPPTMLRSGEETDETFAPLWKTITSGDVWRGELRSKRKDGAPLWVSAIVAPIRSPAGAITHYVGVADDITQTKSLEDQLRHAQKMEAVGVLAGGVAHDFNNLLSAIVSFAELLRAALPAGGPEHGWVTEILAAADRASGLTRSLLAFSREQPVESKPFDVGETVSGFQRLLGRLLSDKVEVKLRLAGEKLVVGGDRGQLEQVLLNLSTNARDAMPEGGTLEIVTEKVVLHAPDGELRAGAYALVTVSDTGVGMERTTLSRIFEPFFTTKEVGRGTGLGLAIVYGIVKRHGGAIRATSEPGRGTTFRIYLPLLAAPLPESQTPGPASPGGGDETILLAEDEPAVRRSTRLLLEQHGYTVLEASDGLEAVSVFEQNRGRIQLVICDLVMPKQNGREACEAIRRIRPGIPVLFVSGYGEGILAGKGLGELGELVAKPVKLPELLATIRAVLAGRQRETIGG